MHRAITIGIIMGTLAAICVFPGGVIAGDDTTAAPTSAKTITISEDQLRQIVRDEVHKEITSMAQAELKNQMVRLKGSVLSTQQVLQSQIELYKIQHNDHAPTLATLGNNWQGFLSRSDVNGKIDDQGFGPYLSQAPMNPIMGTARVAGKGHPGNGIGWTYDEKTGIVRIVVPNGFDRTGMKADGLEVIDPKASAVSEMLQTLRSELELYKIQHHDRFPTLVQIKDSWGVMLQATDADGNPSHERYTYGPYLQQAPANPLNQKTPIVAAGHAGADAGWTYNEKTGAIKACAPESADIRSLQDSDIEKYQSLQQTAADH